MGSFRRQVDHAAYKLAKRASDGVLIFGPLIAGRFIVGSCDSRGTFRSEEVRANDTARTAIIYTLASLPEIKNVFHVESSEIAFARECAKRWPGPAISQIVRRLEFAG